MTGSLSESHYSVVKEQARSDQQTLSSYGTSDEPTTIAVVSKPGDLTEYCDEWVPALGMPERFLRRYRQYLSGYKTNSAVDSPHWRAWDDAQLEHEYLQHVRRSDDAQDALNSIVSRLRDGEDITLVCFEKDGEPCHRHLLVELIEARLHSDFFADESKVIA